MATAMTSKISARNVAALDDAGLDRFIRENRPAGGGEVFIDLVDALKDLPKDELELLIQRLKNRSGVSRPVDLDQVSARLLQPRHATAAENNDMPAQTIPTPPRRQRTPTPPLPTTAEYKVMERGYYDELVADGGRACYPIHLIDGVSENPKKYHNKISFWASDDREAWMVFRKQHWHWKRFRTWQRNHRPPGDLEAEFADYWDDVKRDMIRIGAHKTASRLDEDREDRFEYWKLERVMERDCFTEDFGDDGLAGYTREVKARLSRHGFSVPPTFQLKEDPKQQDSLTTWVEYLDCECWWHDHDRAYKESPIEQRKADSQRHVIRWVLEQVPLVEAEARRERTATRRQEKQLGHDGLEDASLTAGKEPRGEGDVAPRDSGSRKRRTTKMGSATHPATATGPQPNKKRRRGGDDDDDDETADEELRRHPNKRARDEDISPRGRRATPAPAPSLDGVPPARSARNPQPPRFSPPDTQQPRQPGPRRSARLAARQQAAQHARSGNPSPPTR